MNKTFFISAIFIMAMIIGIPSYTSAQSPSAAAPASNTTAKIKWVDFEDAVSQSGKKPKKMFLDMYTDWCGWCKKMDQSTFINPVIVDYMNKNFYAVKFNAERKDTVNFKGQAYANSNPGGSRSSHQLAQKLMNGRMSYPSFVFMDENQNVITIVPGFKKAPEFEVIMNYIATDAYKTQKWEEFSATFKGTATE
jgi:thioredoxin-related protein